MMGTILYSKPRVVFVIPVTVIINHDYPNAICWKNVKEVCRCCETLLFAVVVKMNVIVLL